MRLVAGDGEFGLIATGTAPVGIVAFGLAPIGVFAFGPLATGVFVGSVGAGWVRGVVGGVCGGGVVTCWRSFICGGGLAIGGKSTVIGLGLSVDALESEGMSLSWSWNASKPSASNVREWWAWRKRQRDVAKELLNGGSKVGVVLVDELSDVLGQEKLTSGGVVIEATHSEVHDVRSEQTLGRDVDVKVAVEESMEQDGYRSSTHERLLRLRKLLKPVVLDLGLGSMGYWVMIAFLLFLALFVRVSVAGDSLTGIELGPVWAGPPIAPYDRAPVVGQHRVMHGTLAQGDSTLASGEFSDAYEIELVAGEEVEFALSSSDFDTYLIVRGPDGHQEDNDDRSDEDRDSELDFDVTQTGTHRALASSFGEGQTGAYQLVIRRAELPFGLPKGAELSSESVNGTLSAADGQMRSGEHRDHLNRSFTEGQLVHVRLESTDFDAYLIATPPSGGQTDSDDLSGTNAGVDIVSAEEGDYAFTITSASPGETGSYVLHFHVWDSTLPE